LLQLFWVNLHIYFIFGIFLVGVFLVENIFNYLLTKNSVYLIKTKQLVIVFISVIVTSIINPYGYKGFLFPFKIFENYGYKVFENQSVWFIEKLFKFPLAKNFKILLGTLLLSWIFVIYNFVFKKKIFSIALLMISITFSLMASFAIRNFTIFGYFAFVIISLNLTNLINFNFNKIMVFIIFLLILFWQYKINPYIFPNKDLIKIGLSKNNDAAARFFIENNLKGPIFNNYDIGSYLIYYLYPKEKVFTDNRPETYPQNFFKEVYIPMQENETVWQSMDKKYNFNVIFFYLNDVTPWAQEFLIKRVFDTQWCPVFVDKNAIIIVKKNVQNAEIINRFALPKEMFRVVKTK
jgi:hypothetical protein